MILEVPDCVLELLKQRFTLLDHLSFLEFDQDFSVLRTRLSAIHKSSYDAREKILIEHMDTDYYFKECSVGINLRNFIGIVTELDIPYNVFLFYTNHIGIKQEINSLCKDIRDRPLIIESFLSKQHHDPTRIKDIEYNVDFVKYHALCMMNLTRSHRHAVYHAVSPIDRSKLLLSATAH